MTPAAKPPDKLTIVRLERARGTGVCFRMNGRDERIHEEAAALWRELFGEPPPIRADGPMMLDIITKSLPERGYERMTSPHLRPSQIAGPRRQRV